MENVAPPVAVVSPSRDIVAAPSVPETPTAPSQASPETPQVTQLGGEALDAQAATSSTQGFLEKISKGEPSDAKLTGTKKNAEGSGGDEIIEGKFRESSNPDQAVAIANQPENNEATITLDPTNTLQDVAEAKVFRYKDNPAFQRLATAIRAASPHEDSLKIAEIAVRTYEFLNPPNAANQQPDTSEQAIPMGPATPEHMAEVLAQQAKEALQPVEPTVSLEATNQEAPSKTRAQLLQEAQQKITQEPDTFPKAKELKEAIKENRELFKRLLKNKLYHRLYNQETGERLANTQVTEQEIQLLTEETLAEYNVIQQVYAKKETQNLARQITDMLQDEENNSKLTPEEETKLRDITEKITDAAGEVDPEKQKKKKLSLWLLLAALGITLEITKVKV